MVVREKNCYYAIAVTDFFFFLSCAEKKYISIEIYTYTPLSTLLEGVETKKA